MKSKEILKGLISYCIAVMLASVLLMSCNAEGFSPTANSFGGLNKIVVIADQDIWDGSVGDTLRFYLSAAYPVLPQPEPIFDLKHFTQEEIKENPDRLRFRNIIYLADIGNTNSTTSAALTKIVGEENILKVKESETKSDVKISNGRWAVDQTALFFYSDGEEAAIENIITKSSSIAKLVREHDEEMMEHRIYFSGKHVSLNNRIKEQFGMNITIPGNYSLALDEKEDNFMWIRKLEDDTHVHTNILIHKIPYKNVEQLDPENVKNLRNGLGKKYIESGQVEGSFMRVNDINLPLFHEKKNIDEKFGLELRGIWEMSADSDMMGGPFMSYMVHNPAQEELIFVDAFAFAPGKKKRDLMQGMELILNTISFDE